MRRHRPARVPLFLALVVSSVGAMAARTSVVEAAPRPPRSDRVIVTDTGDGGRQLAEFLIERGLA